MMLQIVDNEPEADCKPFPERGEKLNCNLEPCSCSDSLGALTCPVTLMLEKSFALAKLIY